MIPESEQTRDVHVHVSGLPAPFADAVEEWERNDPEGLRASFVAAITFRLAYDEFLTWGIPRVRKA